MTKTRVYDLAKAFGMKGPAMAKLLRDLGFENIKSHMAVLDTADEMIVVARLEAQGLERSASVAAAPAETGVPKKKAIGKTPQKKPLKKKLVAAEEAAPEPAKKSLPEPAAPKLTAKKEEEAIAIASPVAEPVEKEAAAVEPEPAPPAAPPAEEAPAAEQVPAAQQAPVAEKKTAPEPQAPPEEPPREEPSGKKGGEAPPAGGTAPAESQESVKRLLIPQKKATVVGRIELPQQVIRDATRRSAPNAGTAAADRDLRRKALQSTQGRHAGRPGGGRRGPSRGGMRDRSQRGGRPRKTSTKAQPTVDPNKVVEIEPPISIKGLSEALGIKVNELIATLTFKLGVAGKTINSFLTPEEVELVALELERKVQVVEHKEAEEQLLEQIQEQTTAEDEIIRAPVVTFMGHVDHGKTTLLDALRHSDVVKGEAGGITQHIGAYKVTNEQGHSIVVLDTPGHAAFTAMRARGANITDVVVLVVAADDGVMPQTEEAVAHARAAGAPIVVAINKCDKPGANPMQVKQQLSVKGLQSEEWGGNTGMVEVSALKGTGLDDLVERILLETEILELKARPSAPGKAIIVESKRTPEQGVVVSVLVIDGTLRVKDQVLCGESLARVRGMVNDRNEVVEEAGPSTPVEILGLDKLPMPGDKLYVVADTKKAKEVVEDRQRRARDISLAERSAVTLENLSAALAKKDIQELKVILKADVMGSLEPIKKCLADLQTEEVRVNIVHSALGGISETDVSLAEASGAVIIGFNSVADTAARQAADRAGVDIRYYDVIYELIDAMRLALEGLLAPDEVENVIGHAEVRALFKSSRFGTIAGCYVTDGLIRRNGKARLARDGRTVYTGSIDSLRRIKDDVKEVRSDYECGLTLKNFNDIKEGDVIEVYEIELVKRSL